MKLYGRSVLVVDGNWERALRKFKKKVTESGILNDVREREHYVKPTTRRKQQAGAARARWQKHLKNQQLLPRQF